MEMSIGALAGIMLVSGLKLLITPSIFIGTTDYPYWEIALACALGASFSGSTFYFVGRGLDALLKKFPKKNKKINFSRNRKIIRVKNKFKLFGVCMLIGVLSVPIGSVLVGKYFENYKKAVPALVLASFIWSFGVTYIQAIFIHFLKPLFA